MLYLMVRYKVSKEMSSEFLELYSTGGVWRVLLAGHPGHVHMDLLSATLDPSAFVALHFLADHESAIQLVGRRDKEYLMLMEREQTLIENREVLGIFQIVPKYDET